MPAQATYNIAIWEEIRDKIKPRIDDLVKDIAANIAGDESLTQFQRTPPTSWQLYAILEQRVNGLLTSCANTGMKP